MSTPSYPMRRLFRYLRRYRRPFSWASLASISNKVLDLMPPLLVGWIIDNLTGQAPAWLAEWFGVESRWGGALFLSAAIIVIFGFESLFEWLYKIGFQTLAQRVQHDLRLDAYDHLQHREVAYFERSRTGNLMAILNDDINQLERFLNSSFNEFLQLIVLFIFASFALFAYAWELALIGIAAIPLIILGSLWYQRIIAPRYQRIREAVGALSSRLENNISGIMVVKSFSAEAYERQRVAAVSEDYRQANVSAIRLNATYVPVIRTFIALGFAGCMLLGSWWVIEGTGKITAGGLTFFGMMIQRLLWPMTRMGAIFDEYERARASARRIFGLMDTPNQLPNPAQPVRFAVQGGLRLEGVHFAYDPRQPILRGLDLDIPPGETIGIAGPSGAGKTTLIKLLLRLYDPSQGRITLDGHDLRALDPAFLRRHVALVSQDTYLFHGTIAENIAYGLPEASPAAIAQAARQAQLAPFIEGLPEGYDSLVGERGIKLSGGQRQRLSIARAILKDAPVLILDEATSSVDSETEAAIQAHLDQLVQGRTALIIAHRLSTLRKADRIVVLQDGRIAETGHHEALLQRQGVYAGLWEVQTGG